MTIYLKDNVPTIFNRGFMGVANREPEDGMGGPGGLEGSIGGVGGAYY